MTDSKQIIPTDALQEAESGRVALWLDVDDLVWLSATCSCTNSTPELVRERCSRIRFRAHAALHKSGLKSNTSNEP
jgi:hypothetical protein